MARKSRKPGVTPEISSISREDYIYPTAIYARLSVENSNKDDGGASLENQVEVCKEYIQSRTDLSLIKIYRDNGWTGTVMSRPAFNEMMEDVKAGIIKAVVVRDLSRLARNYIEAGTYLEKIFPGFGTRFISVREGLDMQGVEGDMESLMVPLQNLINDLYSKDISHKAEAALHTQMENGTFAWRSIPYGYKWNDTHTNIVPDENTAEFVRKIFKWRREGLSLCQIAMRLDELKAPKYFWPKCSDNRPWAMRTIFHILRNPAYKGTRVYGVHHSAIYKGIYCEKRPEEEWYVIESAHEAIVTEEDFEAVQEMVKEASEKRQKIMESSKAQRKKIVDVLEGKVFCGDCGYRLYFHKRKTGEKRTGAAHYYLCSSYYRRRWIKCGCHYTRQDILEEKVFSTVRTQIETALDYEKLITAVVRGGKDNCYRDSLNSKIQQASLKLNAVRSRRQRLYEDYSDGVLDEKEYLFAREKYKQEYDQLDKKLGELLEKRNAYKEAMSSENKWIRLMKGINEAHGLTKELVDAVIEKVLVYEGGAIEIVMKYQDVFDLTKQSIERFREGGGEQDA